MEARPSSPESDTVASSIVSETASTSAISSDVFGDAAVGPSFVRKSGGVSSGSSKQRQQHEREVRRVLAQQVELGEHVVRVARQDALDVIRRCNVVELRRCDDKRDRPDRATMRVRCAANSSAMPSECSKSVSGGCDAAELAVGAADVREARSDLREVRVGPAQREAASLRRRRDVPAGSCGSTRAGARVPRAVTVSVRPSARARPAGRAARSHRRAARCTRCSPATQVRRGRRVRPARRPVAGG